MRKIEMKPMSQVMEDLRQDGYTGSFNFKDNHLVCSETNEAFEPDDLVIVNTYRFEGESDPGDMTIVFAMQANSGTKGLCVDAYGYDASRSLGEFIKQVKIMQRETE